MGLQQNLKEINVKPPKEQNRHFRHLPSCCYYSSNPPPDLISLWDVVINLVSMTNARTECRSDAEPSPSEIQPSWAIFAIKLIGCMLAMLVRVTNTLTECRSDMEPSPSEIQPSWAIFAIKLIGCMLAMLPSWAIFAIVLIVLCISVMPVRVTNALTEYRSDIEPSPSEFQPSWATFTVYFLIYFCILMIIYFCIIMIIHVARVRHMTNVVPIDRRTYARTFGWVPEWLIQEVNRALTNLQEVDCALAQFYLLFENNSSVHGGTRHSGKDAKGMFTGSEPSSAIPVSTPSHSNFTALIKVSPVT
ncbi:hypothetical protein FIBSPDRAFT_902009 [Athelia psychrophila]|uniref:Uncharacterized protein n=1 Tax=Athelia psychrophila TaxID=1759441 RepID=A0A167XRE0_9AGAM|nr:hypothetical protein FIBSPDRAFT_902009 [Fibularhizoctonia sp. CBS 109695]